MTREYSVKKYPTIACCGLDCGLCPVYYTKGPSRCPGCCGSDFFSKHPSCSIITCCIKKHNFETCADCAEFPCSKINKWDKADSFISHQVSLSNLRLIQEEGIDNFYAQQERRIKILEDMLDNFNEGRSKSFFCIATALLSIEDLEQALMRGNEQIKNGGIGPKDLKAKSKILKTILNGFADKREIELKLRRKN
ncbi:MAG: DUF3795 domain-containing protein [Promethearchaeota archaeon]|nr:MAG: DUF3795 domain-containing protein [Candidatus Lokiarchaeota archaeon]